MTHRPLPPRSRSGLSLNFKSALRLSSGAIQFKNIEKIERGAGVSVVEGKAPDVIRV